MLQRAAGLEIRAPDLAERVVLLAPAEPHHVEQNARLLGIERPFAAQPAQGIGPVQHELRDALGMARGVFDADRAAPARR